MDLQHNSQIPPIMKAEKDSDSNFRVLSRGEVISSNNNSQAANPFGRNQGVPEKVATCELDGLFVIGENKLRKEVASAMNIHEFKRRLIDDKILIPSESGSSLPKGGKGMHRNSDYEEVLEERYDRT